MDPIKIANEIVINGQGISDAIPCDEYGEFAPIPNAIGYVTSYKYKDKIYNVIRLNEPKGEEGYKLVDDSHIPTL